MSICHQRWTHPLLIGCLFGKYSVVHLLLQDPRVDAALADNEGRTPLWQAACSQDTRIVEWLIASGKDLGDVNTRVKFNRVEALEGFTALENARMK